MAGPGQRSMALLRKQGWDPWVVEKWIAQTKRRLDLWNFGDIIAMKDGEPHLIVQTTSGSNVSSRVAKIVAEPRALMWLQTGGRIAVHGWRKVLQKPGSSRRVWKPREVEITLEDFERN